MQGVGNLAPPSAPPRFLFQHQTSKANLSLLPLSLSNYPSSLSLSLLGRIGFCLIAQNKERNGFSLFAQNKIKNPAFNGVKMEESEDFDDEFEFDDDEDYEFDEDDDEDDEFDDDDDDELVPFEKMNDWLEKKPRGFGEGKVYDTSLEDKLLEELEQSFKAQLANIEKLKREAIQSTSKIKVQEELFNASEGVPGGIRVRINNLPKKKNIHRDLKSAFERVPGIINISPVNSGNKKTRDPICKGLAFIDFKSLKDANSFIQMFSGQIVSFGKLRKSIRCEILKPIDSSHEGLSYDGYNSISEGSFAFIDEDQEEDDDGVERYDSEDDDFQELVEAPNGKYVLGNSEKLNAKDYIKPIESLESKTQARAGSYEKEKKSTKDKPDELKASKGKSEVKNKPQRKPNQKADKKPSIKSDKKPNPSIPGSSKKLKVREKAKLADVFSRYGMRDAKASKEM